MEIMFKMKILQSNKNKLIYKYWQSYEDKMNIDLKLVLGKFRFIIYYYSEQIKIHFNVNHVLLKSIVLIFRLN